MTNSEIKRCYYCGRPAQSREHAPPKQMFKGFDCDSITVPSCVDHNSKKGGHDQAIVSALLLPLHTGRDRYLLQEEVIRAINEALPSFERTKRRAIKSALLKNPPPEFEDLPDLAFLTPSINVAAWARQLTAALVCDVIGTASSSIRWRMAGSWSPDWIAADGPASVELAQATQTIIKNNEAKTELDRLKWENGWSARPKPYPSVIYSFQVHLGPNRDVTFRHRFYDRYTLYVWFHASKRIVAGLQKVLSSH